MRADPSGYLANRLALLALTDHKQHSPLHEGEFCVSSGGGTGGDGDRADHQTFEHADEIFVHMPAV